jgi:hypothetical protein
VHSHARIHAHTPSRRLDPHPHRITLVQQNHLFVLSNPYSFPCRNSSRIIARYLFTIPCFFHLVVYRYQGGLLLSVFIWNEVLWCFFALSCVCQGGKERSLNGVLENAAATRTRPAPVSGIDKPPWSPEGVSSVLSDGAVLDAAESWNWPATTHIQERREGAARGKFKAKHLSGFITESQALGGTLLEQFWTVLGACHPKLEENSLSRYCFRVLVLLADFSSQLKCSKTSRGRSHRSNL